MKACQVCDGTLSRYRHDWLLKCEGCGVLHGDFTVSIPSAPGEVAIREDLREEGLSALRDVNNRRILSALSRTQPNGTLLDVGCGPGFLLSQAKDYSAQGIEPDANVVETARRRGAPVRHGYFPDALMADERFDVIVFNDVLEHIPDLAAALQAAARHLRDGGILCLNCPDRRGLFFKAAAILDRLGLPGAYDRLWQRDLPSPHVWYFTPENLAQAVEPLGLREVARERLETVQLKGLWQRIRLVRDQSMPLSIAAYVFSVATYPLARLFPADSTAVLFRKC